MDSGYQYLYQEGDPHGQSDYAVQAISPGREDLQGIMGPPPMPMPFPGQLTSLSDITALNSYHNLFPMVPYQADDIQDLRLSPVRQSLGYAEAGHGRNAVRNDLLWDPSADQDAWNALRVTGVSQASMPHTSQALNKRRRILDDDTIHPSERAFSDAGSQSHAEAPPSDSGYGTKSVTTRSIIDPYNTGDMLVVPSCGARNNARCSLSSSEYNFGGHELSPSMLSQASSEAFPQPEKGLVECSFNDCKWTGKSMSEKKKHETRHLKPFKCDRHDCSRSKEGFGTVNDLDRHRRSVHGLEPKKGELGKLYKCFSENCPRGDKEWPRQDNFRQHLRRMHGKPSVDDLMKRSDMWYETAKRARQESPKLDPPRPRHGTSPTPAVSNPRPHDSISSVSSLGPWARDNIEEQAEGESVMPMDLAKDLNTPTITSELNPLESSIDDPPNSNPVSDVRGHQRSCSNASVDTSTGQRRCQSANSQSIQTNSEVYSLLSRLRSGAGEDKPTKTAVYLIQRLTKQMDIWDKRRRLQDEETHYSNHTTPLRETPRTNDNMQEKNDELQRLLLDGLRQLGVEPGNLEPSHSGTFINQSNAENNDQQQTYECSECGKKLDNQRKLTKHMKRHDRLYACTFPDCTSRRFGSKNDWKRHENSQHFQLQCWRCHIKSDIFPFAECNSLFFRREKFISHLDRHHKVTEEHKISTFLKTDEIGRNRQSRFWCGFCRKIIALKHRGMDAWNERFNHIDEQHFKMGETIDTWQHPEIQSDSPDHDDGKEGDNASDGDELIESDNDLSAGPETTQNVGGSDERAVQRPGVVPIIKINSEQTDDNDHASNVYGKYHDRRRPDAFPPRSIAPQTQKRKFATGPATTPAISQSRITNLGRCDSNQLTASTNAGSLLSAHSDAGSTVSSRTRTNAAAALFPTMYPKKQAKKTLPSDIFSCCHCSGLIVKTLTDECVMCEHRACVFCENCPTPS